MTLPKLEISPVQFSHPVSAERNAELLISLNGHNKAQEMASNSQAHANRVLTARPTTYNCQAVDYWNEVMLKIESELYFARLRAVASVK